MCDMQRDQDQCGTEQVLCLEIHNRNYITLETINPFIICGLSIRHIAILVFVRHHTSKI